MDGSSGNGDELALFAMLAGLLGLALLILFLVNLVLTFFLWSAYKAVPREHQKIPSGLVWLCVVPCIGSLMLIVCSVLVPLSFQAAFSARSRTDQGDCGLMLGLIGSVGMCVGSAIPVIGPMVGIACLIVYLVFLVKIAGCKRTLLAG